MKLQKPTWINHDGHPIFSVDIHPNTPRFATGGQGADSMGRVVIWGLGSIEFPDSPNKTQMAKFLCQLDHHSACVNCVRWSNKGKYLASGGDDKVIIIWELKGHPALHPLPISTQNSAFGKTSQETWKPVFTLRSHTGDILDLSWSPDDRYLASASVDNKVLIWDARKFPTVVAEITGHTSLVKGVTWDPVGTYLATQSDDQTLKIWRTSDWVLEHTLTESFIECGGTTHVLRLDWSPDGAYLVSAHAMNCGGPTAQIVERDGWKTDKDFVGHRKAVVCVRFTRTMLQKGKGQLCYVALGSRDRSLSIWSTALKRPLLVVRDTFANSVMDLSWSSDAQMMMACSGDGTVAVATFSQDEIGVPLNEEEMILLHQRVYGKKLNYLSNSSNQLVQSVEVFMARKKAEEEERRNSLAVSNHVESQASRLLEEAVPTNPAVEVLIRGPTDKQIETRTPDGKRRITPKFLLPQNDVQYPPFHTGEEIVFGEPRIIDTTSTVGNNLRNNMVSGIDDVRNLAETAALSPAVITPDTAKHNNQEPKKTESGQKKRIVPTRVLNGAPVTQAVVPGEKINGEGSSSQTKSDSSTQPPLVNGFSSNHNGEVTANVNKVPDKEQEDATPSSKAPGETRMNVAMKRGRVSDESNVAPPKKSLKPSTPLDLPKKPSLPQASAIPLPSSSAAAAQPVVQSANTPVAVTRGKLLTPLKIEDSMITKVQIPPNLSYQLEVSNRVNGTNWLKCQHETTSLDALHWNISTESPICAIAGDGSRVVGATEDGSVHILDLKGRYALPPFLIPSLPAKLCLNGAHLLIVTTRATVHVWNIHLFKSIIKSESILSLLNANSTLTLHAFQATVTADGAPLVRLSNGKQFLFNSDMQTWVSITESSQSLATLRSSFSGVQTDSMLKKENSITFIKLRLASAIQLLKTKDVQNTLVVLAKALATKACKRELHVLCQDLLGPTHSAASALPPSDPQFGGVDKRKVLREILNMLLTDLQWQDFYIEFDEMLNLVESGSSALDNCSGGSSR